MKTTFLRWCMLGGCIGAVTVLTAQTTNDLTPAPSERALPSTAIPDRYIVQVAAGVDPRAVAATHGVSPNFVYQRAVRGFAGTVAPGRLTALRADSRVVSVSPDRRMTAVAKPGGGGSTPPAQVTPVGIDKIGAAPGSLSFDGTGIGVAVVDTGVDFAHADLQVSPSSFSSVSASAQDNHGHGTHVAGTIAAKNDGFDVVGVAPKAMIYAVKVLDASGSGADSEIIAGLEWVAINAATVIPAIKVVNMSLGRVGTLNDNPALRAAVSTLHASGIAVVVAAGNDAGLEVSQQVPSTYPEVIAVGSVTAQNGINQYRNFSGLIAANTASYFTSDGALVESPVGSDKWIGVTISAPGEDQEDISKAGFIQSVGILSTKLGGGTTRMSGTSMAAPHVAGVAALIYQKAAQTGITVGAEDVRDRLRASAIYNYTRGSAPINSPTTSYSFDNEREGVVSAPGALVP